jgi:nitrate/nitrite-specific signal transduction histidine kinase
MVNQSIIAFQFYDRLAQRLSHVNHSLAMLAELVADSARADSASEWTSLQQAIRARYSMPEEVEMFEAVLVHGMPVQQAVDQFMQRMADRSNGSDDIELF